MLAGNFSTCCGLLNVSGPAAALSESLEHSEQTKIPPSCTIQLPSSAVVTVSLLRPQSEHLPFVGSCCAMRPMVPTLAPANGGWLQVAPQAIPTLGSGYHTLELRSLRMPTSRVEHPLPTEALNQVKARLGHLVTGMPSTLGAQYAETRLPRKVPGQTVGPSGAVCSVHVVPSQ